MAVTIHTTPEDFTPSDNPVQWTFSSDQTAQANFIYKVDLYINDTLVARELIQYESGIYAKFDASGYASNYCNTPQISQDAAVDANNYCTVRITVTERYGDPIADQASSAATNIVCWKSRQTDEDFVDWDASTYTPTGVSTGAWLTPFPSTTYPKVQRTDESIRLLMINNLNNVTLTYKLYDADGVLITSDTYGYTATSFYLIIANVSPEVIITETTITTANFAAASYYTVSTTGVLMPEYRINLSDDMLYSTYKRLHFLTSWGSIESFSFGLISRKSGSVESFGYKKRWGAWSGNSFTRTKAQGRDIDYAKSVDLKLICVSDWLTQAVQNWLAFEIKSSPLVYIEEPSDNSLERRKVMSRTIDWKIQENDVIFLEQVEIMLPSYNSAVI